jgi:hypothetical protein
VQRVSRENQEGRREFEHAPSDLRAEDIAGSGFAITGYTVHPSLIRGWPDCASAFGHAGYG